MSIRLENIHTDVSPANYVSFLNQHSTRGRSDRDSIHSVSSVRSVMSGMSSLWASFGIGSSNAAAKSEKAKAAAQADLRYLYSAFTKIPCLRLSPDHRAKPIRGFEEFPFDTAVPLYAFKNVSALEVVDVDFRQFFGWDRLADNLRSLTVKRGNLDDLSDLLTGIVLDDMDKRRRRSSKTQSSPIITWATQTPPAQKVEFSRSNSAPGSPVTSDSHLSHSASPQSVSMARADSDNPKQRPRAPTGNTSPTRPKSARHGTSYKHVRGSNSKLKRSGSGSSNSSCDGPVSHYRRGSSSNLLSAGILPANKWRFLRHLSLADNGLTFMSSSSLMPLMDSLHSLDLSSNLFTEIPDGLAALVSLRALNMCNCMIGSLHSLLRNPLPAITAFNLRANRLQSIAGIERLLSLERLDLRDNKLTDPMEISRLTCLPNIREIWVANNPLVKTHANYRITIFNLFRQTPGFLEDIIIDGTGPGYNERRQLVERVAEPEGVPVMKPTPEEIVHAPIDVRKAIIRPVESVDNAKKSRKHRPIPESIQSEIVVGSNRRRKGPRRRIVDLTHDESNLESYQKPIIESEPPRKSEDSALGLDPDEMSPTTKAPFSEHAGTASAVLPRIDTNPAVLRESHDRAILPHIEDQEWDVSSELYRQKLEALKNEVGNGWLSVLGDDGWDGGREPKKDVTKAMSPASTVGTTPRVQSPAGVVAGGRTLG